MLLLNICVLAGAVITPPSLRWVYSTHIILLCLYQFYRKDWWGVLFVVISIISLISSKVWVSKEIESKVGPFYWNAAEHCLQAPSPFLDLTAYVKSKTGSLMVRSCQKSAPVAELVEVSPSFAKLFGTYQERTAYVKGADLMVYVGQLHLPGRLSNELDRYASWRFAYSIIRGDRNGWNERDRWLVNYLGLTHLFVVSGLHIGFVCLLGIWGSRILWRCVSLFRQLTVKRAILDFLVVVPLSISYALWSGAGEPAVRASLMAIMFFAVRAKAHNVSIFSVLTFSAWLMLLLWPARALDPSFWLSYVFVALIAMLAGREIRGGRIIIMQAFLSLFALLLTLGWQQSLSGLTLIANVVMVPFVGIVWFPTSLLSFWLNEMTSWTWLYQQLDRVLVWLFSVVEPYIFSDIFLLPRSDSSLGIKLALIVIAFFAVYWFPLRRSIVVLCLTCVAALSFSYTPQWNYLWVKDRYGVVQYYREGGKVLSYDDRPQIKLGSVTIALNLPDKHIAHQALENGWQLALIDKEQSAKHLLRKMKVSTMEMTEGEEIRIFTDSGIWQVESSTCYQLLNLLKTGACEHAELLESMLNYSQFDTGGLGVRDF